jgi:hypothetical protein
MNPLVAWFLMLATTHLEIASFWTEMAERIEDLA